MIKFESNYNRLKLRVLDHTKHKIIIGILKNKNYTNLKLNNQTKYLLI